MQNQNLEEKKLVHYLIYPRFLDENPVISNVLHPKGVFLGNCENALLNQN